MDIVRSIDRDQFIVFYNVQPSSVPNLHPHLLIHHIIILKMFTRDQQIDLLNLSTVNL
jgi:hypothetical protein